MKKIICFSMLILFMITGKAQNKDHTQKERDSVYQALRKDYIAKDSVYHFERNKKRTTQRDSLRGHFVYDAKDSLYLKTQKDFVRTKSLYNIRYADSTNRKRLFSARVSDSLHRLNKLKRLQSDSSRKATTLRYTDSLHRLYKLRRLTYDSSGKSFSYAAADSFQKVKLFRSQKMDSVKRKQALQNLKADSARLKKYLDTKKIRIQQLQDTVAVKDGYRSRRLLMEISCFNGDTVYINNSYRKVIIKTVPQQRVKLAINVIYKEAMNDRDGIVLNKLGIEYDRTSTSVTANIKGLRNEEDREKILKSRNMTAAEYQELSSEVNQKQTLFIEVPANAFIALQTKYTESCVENYVNNIRAEIQNGTFKMGSGDKVAIQTKYSTVTADDIKKADLNFSNSSFIAGNIADIRIVSAASKVKMNNCSTMNLSSVSDEYLVATAGSIAGKKDFGKFNIETLQEKLDLKGTNADLGIKYLSYDAPFIKIDSKYADLKLPLYDQKNYSLNYEGSYTDINRLSVATEKLNAMGNIKATLTVKTDTAAVKNRAAKTKYEATAGDITGKHAKVDIICPYCNVVFN